MSILKFRKLQKLLDKEAENESEKWDTDEDLADHEFQLKETFDL